MCEVCIWNYQDRVVADLSLWVNDFINELVDQLELGRWIKTTLTLGYLCCIYFLKLCLIVGDGSLDEVTTTSGLICLSMDSLKGLRFDTNTKSTILKLETIFARWVAESNGLPSPLRLRVLASPATQTTRISPSSTHFPRYLKCPGWIRSKVPPVRTTLFPPLTLRSSLDVFPREKSGITGSIP